MPMDLEWSICMHSDSSIIWKRDTDYKPGRWIKWTPAVKDTGLLIAWSVKVCSRGQRDADLFVGALGF